MTSSVFNKPILYLDTTGPCLMMGLSRGEALAARHQEVSTSHRYHSAVIVPAIQALLESQQLSPQNLGGLAVNIGPGSFTGIRTGLSTVRTLAQFLEVPVYAFNTFELLAAKTPEMLTAIYLDALQGNAYRAVLSFTRGKPVYQALPTLASLSEPEDFPAVGRWMVAESLLKAFSENSPDRPVQTIEALGIFTPEMMCHLLAQEASYYCKPWPDVLPLYLQEPNITLRKPQAGSLK